MGFCLYSFWFWLLSELRNEQVPVWGVMPCIWILSRGYCETCVLPGASLSTAFPLFSAYESETLRLAEDLRGHPGQGQFRNGVIPFLNCYCFAPEAVSALNFIWSQAVHPSVYVSVRTELCAFIK